MHFLFALMIPWTSALTTFNYSCAEKDRDLLESEVGKCLKIKDTYWADYDEVLEECKKQVLDVFCTPTARNQTND